MDTKGYGLFICLCADREFIYPGDVREVQEAASKYDLGFAVLHPGLCSKGSGLHVLSTLAETVEKVVVVGCHRKAQRLLFQTALDPDKLVSINLRDSTVEKVIEELDGLLPVGDEPRTEWFPVIDKDLCDNCRQCLEFCLFGVFDIDDDEKIYVKNPYNCKDNCPACARVCHRLAIVFPKCVEAWMAGADVPAPDYVKTARTEIVKRMKKIRKEYDQDEGASKDKRSVKQMLEEFAQED